MLAIKDLRASYGGIEALRGLTLDVLEGEMVALIGSNGAGKSTLLNCLSGIIKSMSGTIVFEGLALTSMRPAAIACQGLLHVPEGRQILVDMSVEENLLLGKLARGRRNGVFDVARVMELFPRLEERRGQRAGSLSGGEQQMLAIGRALMGAPRLLLLDEPSLGLSPLLTTIVFDALKKLNAEGLTILLVEQNAKRALEVTSRAYVMEHGLIVHQGASNDLINDPRVAAHYLGGAIEPDYTSAPAG